MVGSRRFFEVPTLVLWLDVFLLMDSVVAGLPLTVLTGELVRSSLFGSRLVWLPMRIGGSSTEVLARLVHRLGGSCREAPNDPVWPPRDLAWLRTVLGVLETFPRSSTKSGSELDIVQSV